MADNTSASPAAPEPLVRIYNKSQRTILGKYSASPVSFAAAPKSVADAWMKQWPTDIVLAAEAIAEVGGATAEANELRTKLAASEKRVADLEARLGKPNNKRILELEAALADAQSKISALEDSLTKPQSDASVV